MKKKGTRKIRKNKRTTQRRKNRSYKRMRGGMFNFKSKGFLNKKSIPEDVKGMIDTYTEEGEDHELNLYYKVFLENKSDNRVINLFKNNSEEIKSNITTVTRDTEETVLTSLPISTVVDVKDLIDLIDSLLRLEFLPTVPEFGELYEKFYGKKGKKAEKDDQHQKPYKYNGFALAVFLASLIKPPTTSVGSSAAVARAAPASSPKPDLTGIPQRYFIWLGSTGNISWISISYLVRLNDNPYCPSSKRTHLRSVNGQVLNNHNKSLLTYNSKKPEDLDSKEIGMVQQIEQYITFLQSQSTLPGTYIHIVDKPGTYLYYELQKLSVEEEVSRDPKRSSCKVPVTLYVIKRYAEDGICDRVYVEYLYGAIPIPQTRQQYDPCSEIVDIPTYLKTKYVDNVKKELSAAFTGFVNAIPLTFGTQRDESAQATQTITAPRILSPGNKFSGICTLMLSFPISGEPKWDVAQATTIQSDAFTAVQKYITSNPSSIEQINVFSISNSDKSIHVHIIVKKIGANNTLISAEYISNNGETYELFNNQASAIQRATEKKIHHQQVFASGPSTTPSYAKPSYLLSSPNHNKK
jgi:hypothetical protein